MLDDFSILDGLLEVMNVLGYVAPLVAAAIWIFAYTKTRIIWALWLAVTEILVALVSGIVMPLASTFGDDSYTWISFYYRANTWVSVAFLFLFIFNVVKKLPVKAA